MTMSMLTGMAILILPAFLICTGITILALRRRDRGSRED